MEIVKNRLAELIISFSEPASDEVLDYLTQLHNIKNSNEESEKKTEALNFFEKSHRSSSFKVDMYCVIANYVNQKPILCVVLCFALLYNVVWAVAKLIKHIL